MTTENNNWRFCAVGNIKAQHQDEGGNILYGTKAFRGGTKIYIDDRSWGRNAGHVRVIGLNRDTKYAIESVSIELIENVRIQRVYQPTVLKIMEYVESTDGWEWSGRTAQDRKELKAFIELWQGIQLDGGESNEL